MNTMNKELATGALAALLLTTAGAALASRSALDPGAAKLDMDAAKVVALAEVPGAVMAAELDKEDGAVVWEFEIVGADGKRMEVLIDANNGALISSREDRERAGGWFDHDGDDDHRRDKR